MFSIVMKMTIVMMLFLTFDFQTPGFAIVIDRRSGTSANSGSNSSILLPYDMEIGSILVMRISVLKKSADSSLT